MPSAANSNVGILTRASTSSEAASSDLPGSPAIAAALISISIIILAAAILILYRFWLSHSKRRRMKASVAEFDMAELTRKLHGSNINDMGIISLSGVTFTQVVDINQTRPSMRTTATTATPDNMERRKFSVIDISPEVALRLGLARHSTLPFLSTTSISSNPTLMRIDGSSNSHLPISHHRTMTIDSLAPSIVSNVDKPLPRRPSQAESSYPLRTQQLPEPGHFPPGGLSSASSSPSHLRSESEASLFSFIQNRASSIRAENDDISMPPSIHIPTAAAAGYVGHPFSGQVVAGNKLYDDDQINATHKHETNFIDPLIHSGQDARQTLPRPWFERVASTSRAHQPTTDTSRISHHRLDITVPEPLRTTRRYSHNPLCRSHSTATTLMTPPPPPYTPLDANFEVPPLPQRAQRRSSQRLILATNSTPDSTTLGHLPMQQIPTFTPSTNDSKATLRSQFNQQQERSNNHGTVIITRPRSNSLPIQNALPPPGPISARRQSRVGTIRPLHINTGAGMTGRAWLPGTIDEIISTTPSRGTFTIEE